MIKRLLKRRTSTNPILEEYGRALKLGRDSFHVIPTDKGWAMKQPGETRGRIFPSRAEAIRTGRQVAKNRRRPLFIHLNDGSVRVGIEEH